ncbi:hypothetical protein Aple_064660 [Acrocarpospora pleiomorpha]|uniref:Abortive infection protein-like C-terminal domain-containing protein n=1 Tax=Acrocarpospora pleiomorpha TaxID=90975 RepID=A0A5M3XQG0_9ACTN|nr:abortive infection family protein [Acrocarpospora pleiomorpha]GES23567.1 hypothetical protein Aple_064660 [Acrocarpospora pleiomorpha]
MAEMVTSKMLATFEFVRPAGMEDASWAAAQRLIGRLEGAVAARDHALAIGCAKELAESVAKAVLVVRGEVVSANDDFPAVVKKAHTALQRQPGIDLAQDSPLRTIAQSARTMVTQLAEIRNIYGTGHGRAQDPKVTDEILYVSLDAVALWIKWALRRLDVLAQGMPSSLIHDLLNGGPFTSGVLAGRLIAADLPLQEVAVQRRLGVAVAQRAMQGTFLIQREGVEACAESDELDLWPAPYREGAFEGLFISQFETPTISTWSASQAARLLTPLTRADEIITSVIGKVRGRPIPVSRETLVAVVERLTGSAHFLPQGAENAWQELIELVKKAASAADAGTLA